MSLDEYTETTPLLVDLNAIQVETETNIFQNKKLISNANSNSSSLFVNNIQITNYNSDENDPQIKVNFRFRFANL